MCVRMRLFDRYSAGHFVHMLISLAEDSAIVGHVHVEYCLIFFAGALAYHVVGVHWLWA